MSDWPFDDAPANEDLIQPYPGYDEQEHRMLTNREREIEKAIGEVMAGRRTAAEVAVSISELFRADNLATTPDPGVVVVDDSEEALLNGGPGITDIAPVTPVAPRAPRAKRG